MASFTKANLVATLFLILFKHYATGLFNSGRYGGPSGNTYGPWARNEPSGPPMDYQSHATMSSADALNLAIRALSEKKRMDENRIAALYEELDEVIPQQNIQPANSYGYVSQPATYDYDSDVFADRSYRRNYNNLHGDYYRPPPKNIRTAFDSTFPNKFASFLPRGSSNSYDNDRYAPPRGQSFYPSNDNYRDSRPTYSSVNDREQFGAYEPAVSGINRNPYTSQKQALFPTRSRQSGPIDNNREQIGVDPRATYYTAANDRYDHRDQYREQPPEFGTRYDRRSRTRNSINFGDLLRSDSNYGNNRDQKNSYSTNLYGPKRGTTTHKRPVQKDMGSIDELFGNTGKENKGNGLFGKPQQSVQYVMETTDPKLLAGQGQAAEDFSAYYSQLSPLDRPENDPESDVVKQEALNAHNELRRKHKVPDLEYDDELAAGAQIWARQMVISQYVKHEFYHDPNTLFGENLSHNSKGNGFTCKTAIRRNTNHWYCEINNYDFDKGTLLAGKRNGTDKFGHFTQVVWKSSKKLGIGCARLDGHIVVVARYSPSGNILGTVVENVPPLPPGSVLPQCEVDYAVDDE